MHFCSVFTQSRTLLEIQTEKKDYQLLKKIVYSPVVSFLE
jgi:hypothetical protein